MPTAKKVHFSIRIAAPVATVWKTMLDPESYKAWTSAFMEGSYYEGTWATGERIRFLAPSGFGMVAVIDEYRPQEFISIKHLGFVSNGVEDTESEHVRSWAPAYENYTFVPVDDGTEVQIDQDITPEFELYMLEIWPKALAKLKALCEATN